MGKGKIFLASVLLIIQVENAHGLSLTAKVDKTEATLEDQIILTLSIEGTRRAGKPMLPSLPDFDMIPRGSSTRMQIINGTITSGIDYNYLLIPKKTGTFEIGPATIQENGETIASNTITLRIASSGTRPQATQDVFITTTVSSTSPYVNEQIIYTF